MNVISNKIETGNMTAVWIRLWSFALCDHWTLSSVILTDSAHASQYSSRRQSGVMSSSVIQEKNVELNVPNMSWSWVVSRAMSTRNSWRLVTNRYIDPICFWFHVRTFGNPVSELCFEVDHVRRKPYIWTKPAYDSMKHFAKRIDLQQRIVHVVLLDFGNRTRIDGPSDAQVTM